MTEEVFLHMCEHLSNHLWLQSLLVIVGTSVLEDAARCAVCLLVATGHIGWWLALVSMTIGGMAGDIGLYLVGRYATAFLTRQRWMDITRLEWMKIYFENHAAKTIFVARFLPGVRMISYSAAGVVCYPFGRFLFFLLLASLIQALIFLQLGTLIGEKLLPFLRQPQTRALIIVGVILCGIVIHLIIRRRRRRNPSRGLLPILLATDPPSSATSSEAPPSDAI